MLIYPKFKIPNFPLHFYLNYKLQIINYNYINSEIMPCFMNTCLAICCCFLWCLSSSDPRNGIGVRSGISNWQIFWWIPSQSAFWCSDALICSEILLSFRSLQWTPLLYSCYRRYNFNFITIGLKWGLSLGGTCS